MQKENVIDLTVYRDRQNDDSEVTSASISKELEVAIQDLIYRLREEGPLQQSS